ncbi:SCO family protein [Bartonella sp. A05]|uniref:SCO family protein n=1 Tax=Bartonella sp. A05 TaxID=2967261 RepID=UPI0022A90C32|nr:SCO family protein [Bartonella sp. A05]MCZ2204049.1 SCO family protein [Bartonella sp. A05]
MKNVIRILGLTIIFLAGVFVYDAFINKPLGDNFTLISSNGEIVTEADIRSKPAVLFFGFTMCPVSCPTTLIDLSRWLEELGSDADKLGVWFVTVDPERDTPEVLREYLSNFTDKIVGISGDPEKIRNMVSSFNVAAEKVPGTNGNYTYNHTAAVFLLKKGGKLAGIIPYNLEENENELRDDIAIKRLKKLAASN